MYVHTCVCVYIMAFEMATSLLNIRSFSAGSL